MTYHAYFCSVMKTTFRVSKILHFRFLWSKSGYERCDARHDELDDSNQKCSQ